MKIFLTGIAGFIGFHLARKLRELRDTEIIGIDNLNSYYSPQLKTSRLAELGINTDGIQDNNEINAGKITFVKAGVENKDLVLNLFKKHKPDYVIHLAAQAGVRYSLQDPYSYISSNVNGFMNILESCRHFPVKHLVFASSSSVYGLNQVTPYSEKHPADHPASLYAATKKSNELMAHSYSYLFKIPSTGLRFFSVYGPWGRPDMAYFSFTEKILKGIPIEVYNYGKMKRDFTYIDDITEGIVRLLDKIPSGNDDWKSIDTHPDRSVSPYRIFNIGNNRSVPLEEFISALEDALGKKAERKYVEAHPGDVLETFANIDNLSAVTGFKPSTDIRAGLNKFVEWYKNYYSVK